MKLFQFWTAVISLLFIGSTALATDPATIWDGPDMTFTKEAYADWTLAENQDQITDTVWLTRQNRMVLYNYKWWQENMGRDASWEEIRYQYWGPDYEFAPELNLSEGTMGVKWGIPPQDSPSTTCQDDWDLFGERGLYATLGDPTNFTTFHRVVSMINKLACRYSGEDYETQLNSTSSMQSLIGKKLAAWIPEEDIYFTINIESWDKDQVGGGFRYLRSTVGDGDGIPYTDDNCPSDMTPTQIRQILMVTAQVMPARWQETWIMTGS